ncbi:MAG TPA: OmpH family outer membrane protein [Bryobacteraceae bacterium]|nr:OmpH family outer membrane protein [Bryobacteraceae bacterium]
MKIRVLTLCSLALAATSAAYAQAAAAPSKVGIIHIQQAVINTRDGKVAAKALEEKSAPKKKQLEQAQAEIAALRDKYAKIGSVGSEEEKRKLQMDIDARTKSFNRDVEDAQQDLDAEQNRVLGELLGRMQAVIDKYARDNGYSLILDISPQNTPVVFVANGIDITQDVVALYDKNAPGPATTSAAPTGTTTTPAKTATPAGAKPTPTAPKPAGAK